MTSHITLGHALITMVEPTSDPERLLEYNRWYEHDHAYAGVMAGPGAFAFRRFVATRDLKARRRPTASPMADPVGTGSFIALYWLVEGSAEEHYAWSFPNTGGLAQAGRMNPDREHVSTSLYDLVDIAHRPDHTVPVEIGLDHPYPGLAVFWVDRNDDASLDDLEAWVRAELPGLLAGSVAGQASVWRPRDFPGMEGTGSGVGTRLCVALFLTADPRGADTDLLTTIESHLAGCPAGSLSLAAEFIPVVPGTTTYLDELW